jgi:hypothetical protein
MQHAGCVRKQSGNRNRDGLVRVVRNGSEKLGRRWRGRIGWRRIEGSGDKIERRPATKSRIRKRVESKSVGNHDCKD